MSFFIIVKHSIKKLDFHYIQKKPKLESTDIGEGRELIYHFQQNNQGALVNAEDLMTEKIIAIQSSDTVKDALKLMKKNQIHHLPVVEGNKVVGLVTSTDLFGMEEDQVMEKELLVNIMGQTVLCVSKDTPFEDILNVFVHERIHCLPVLNSKQDICGIITQTDVFKWMLEHKRYMK